MKVLIKSQHGLGDVIQLTIVLQHLARRQPDWIIDVWAKQGRETACRGLCNKVWNIEPDEKDYQQIFDLEWPEYYYFCTDRPSTKACRCLDEIFHLNIEPDLLKYKINITKKSKALTKNYLESIGCKYLKNCYNAVIIHNDADTGHDKKIINKSIIENLCQNIIDLGFVPIILDWKNGSPIDVLTINGRGDAERIAALMSQSSLVIGVDAGPQKIAGATNTSTIAIWTGLDPLHYYDLCPNVIHLVPENAFNIDDSRIPNHIPRIPKRKRIPKARHFGKQDLIENISNFEIEGFIKRVNGYFKENYKYVFYNNADEGNFEAHLNDLVSCILKETMLHTFHIHPDKQDQDWVIINDVYIQDCYQTKLIPDSEYVLDIGAQIGTFTRLWHERNPQAKIICVEACPENIPILKQNVKLPNGGDFATVIHAACTYEEGDLMLLNSIIAQNPQSTGGSILITSKPDNVDLQYCFDDRPLKKITIHEILEKYNWSYIDLLKLDCEGSEFSILAGAPLDKIKFIIGEYHGFDRWEAFRATRFKNWIYKEISRSGDLGNFHLINNNNVNT